MRSKPKDLGTRMETRIVRAAHDAGLVAERIAEGGANDLGDVRIFCDDHIWTVESKDRTQLNIHQAVEKAMLKSGDPHTVVWWRRMVRKNGNERRTQDGPQIVAMTADVFLELLRGGAGGWR